MRRGPILARVWEETAAAQSGILTRRQAHEGGLTDEALPPALAGYNTYTSKGLPPGPIDTPTLTSIDAALHPDTTDGYLYFLAKGDGSGTTAFAKTFKQHQANIKKYAKP